MSDLKKMYSPQNVTCLKQIIAKPVVHYVNYLHCLEPLLGLAVVIFFTCLLSIKHYPTINR